MERVQMESMLIEHNRTLGVLGDFKERMEGLFAQVRGLILANILQIAGLIAILVMIIFRLGGAE